MNINTWVVVSFRFSNIKSNIVADTRSTSMIIHTHTHTQNKQHKRHLKSAYVSRQQSRVYITLTSLLLIDYLTL